MNAVLESVHPLPHRFTCVTFVNIHGATRVNLTVETFDFQPDFDSFDIGIGYTVNWTDPSYTVYNNENPLVNQTVNTGNFYFVVLTDKHTSSDGYRILLSGDGDDCLRVLYPCYNGGTCIDGWQSYTCACRAGYMGALCETPSIPGCYSEPCLNDATCLDLIDGYNCQCRTGYGGLTCGERTCANVTIYTDFGHARLPIAEVGTFIDSAELCAPEDSEALDTPIVRAVCRITGNGSTYWNTSIECRAGVAKQLKEILKNGISNANLLEVADQLYTITQNYDNFKSTDVTLLYEILQLISDLNSTEPNVADLLVGITNNVMNIEDEVLVSAQHDGNYTTLIVQILESQLNNVDVENSSLETYYPNIAVQVLDLPPSSRDDGLVVTMLSMDTGDLSDGEIMIGTHRDTNTESIPTETFARVVIPIEVTQIFTTTGVTGGPIPPNTTSDGSSLGTTASSGTSSGPGETLGEDNLESLRIVFAVYIDDSLFPSRNANRDVNTPVVSTIIGGQKIDNLMERVNITLSQFEIGSRGPTCNFWEFSLGRWSMVGCELISNVTSLVNSIVDDYYTCACDHLTNFAVLVDIYAENKPPRPALRLLSIIGCAISCLCLAVAIVSYLSVKRVRASQTHRIFICLCATLLCLYISSLAIVAIDTEFGYAEVEWIPCTILAALIHYFVLSSLTWMGIEGFNTYLVIIRVFDTYIPKYLIKSAIVGWGIPAVIVGVTGGITRNSYAVQDYCYIQTWPLIGGLLIPMAIILIVNIMVFILAMCRLEQSAQLAGRVKKDYKAQRQETLERVQNGIAMVILLGFTWITGYLTLINVDIADILFIVFNSLQGFFIFVLYCLRKATIREQWRRCLCCALSQEDHSTGSQGRTPRDTSGTGSGSRPVSESMSSMPHTNPSYESNENA